jgi:di/tricarboxylate transporter
VISESLSTDKAYEALDWRLLILVGGMSAFAFAMTKTGAASFLSHQLLNIFSSYDPKNMLAVFIVLTVLLTLPMNNVAAALIMLPIAIQTAQQMGINPKSFIIGVMLSASLSLITPFEPSCILVRGPGQYKFTDFLKTGLPLTLLLMFVIYKMIPLYYSF